MAANFARLAGGATTAVATLIECHTNPLISSPRYVASPLNLIAFTSVKSSGIPIGFTTSTHAPFTETSRTVQLIVPPLLNAISPSFRMRRRQVCRLADMERQLECGGAGLPRLTLKHSNL